ncbi:MAG: hypothetical protein GF364_12540 [Candidatus Lokiarchaeota archaeon]|nr:hypothetical protein [Candidatus Lokiarchaeota archaeon]
MSVREALVKHLSTILRSSKATILVLLSDESGLSIARIGRSTDLDLDPNAITSVSAAAFSSSEETWVDLNIRDQIIAFSFFEKICLITIRVGHTLLTIVHDYNIEWPLNADNIGSCMFNLKKELNEFFGTDIPESDTDIEIFSNNVRSAIYLFGMGTEIPFASYTPENASELDTIQNINEILDSLQNPVLAMYSIVTPSGLTVDQRDKNMIRIPISTEAFSANANVAFQKMIEEAGSLNIGSLLSYVCISGEDPDNLYGIAAAPSGQLQFVDESTQASSVQDISFIGLFPLTYGAIPVLGEARNIVYSILEVIGTESIAEAFINSVNSLSAAKFG